MPRLLKQHRISCLVWADCLLILRQMMTFELPMRGLHV